MARRKQPSISDEVLDQLLAGSDPRNTLAGKDGLLDALKKALAERALSAELDHHLENGEPDGRTNSRNGYGRKTVLTDTGRMAIEVPRDRLATFDPQLIAKYRRRLPGFNDKVVSLSPLPEATAAGHGMYARGLSVREIRNHLLDLYGIEVSPDLISAVTDAVLDEVVQWQERPLEPLYPLVFFDALRVKVRDEGTVRNKAVHVALGVRPDGTKEVLGLWMEQTEGAKFGLRVMTELKNRGVEDVLIAVVDGLKGFPEAITAVFPQAQVQTCIVHLIRGSLEFVPWKDRKAVATALKEIYRATDAEAGRAALDAFAKGPWGTKYPAITLSWRRNWAAVIPFFAFPVDVRRIVYTTNAIESLNAKLRRAVRTRGHFPTDESALKLLYLVLNLAAKDWKMPPREWGMAKAQFAILFEDRFTLA
jgi:putative transposase